MSAVNGIGWEVQKFNDMMEGWVAVTAPRSRAVAVRMLHLIQRRQPEGEYRVYEALEKKSK